MNTLIQQIRTRWGIDPVTVGIFTSSALLYGLAWWIRQSTVRFNVSVFEIAGGILIVNLALMGLVVRKDSTIGYLLAGAALCSQILLLILLGKAGQGALL